MRCAPSRGRAARREAGAGGWRAAGGLRVCRAAPRRPRSRRAPGPGRRAAGAGSP
ncbi:hypothetical protein [Ornithinimicrobium kibberense]|uniref:hypothetical protein n=1 Tax=Ornithinimicrobium kibberense TaxID=282060 RepID=UPI003623E1C8